MDEIPTNGPDHEDEESFSFDLDFENELRKLKFRAEYGGEIRLMNDTSPEREKQLLDKMEEYGIQFSKGKMTTVWEDRYCCLR